MRMHCLLKHIIEGKIKERINVKVRRGIRRKQLPDDLQETIDRIMEIERKSLDHNLWRTGFRRGCGSVVRKQTA